MLQYDWKRISEYKESELYMGLPEFFQTLPTHTVTAPEIHKAVALENSKVNTLYSLTQYLTEETIIIPLDI